VRVWLDLGIHEHVETLNLTRSAEGAVCVRERLACGFNTAE